MIRIIEQPALIEQDFRADRLVIAEGARLAAPEGHFLTLTVNGMGQPLIPGTYVGDVQVSVSRLHHMPAHGLHAMSGRTEELHTAIVVEDNELVDAECTPAVVQGGVWDGDRAEGIYIGSAEDDFTGIVLAGDSEYTIKGCRFDLDGDGANDFMGVGAGVAAMDNVKLTIEDCDFKLNGRTHCAVHVAGDSIVHVKDSRFTHMSFDRDDFMGDFAWGCAFRGANRMMQLCDNGTAYYEDCDFITNGWGVLSIDGCKVCVRYYIKDCRISLSGPNTFGYGVFCIGDRNITVFDHSKVRVDGYPLIVRSESGEDATRAEIINGSELSGLHYGVLYMGDRGTHTLVADSSIITGKSTFVMKSTNARVNVERSVLKPGNGVICQLMANDEVTQMMVSTSPVAPVPPDTYIAGRDLAAIDPASDCVLNFKEMDVIGDLYNSTHNLHLELGGNRGESPHIPFGDMFTALKPPFDLATATPEMVFPDLDTRGPKNLEINFVDAHFEGVASSATERHRDDLDFIDETTRLELSNVIQTPAPTVNNGVIVNLDRFSTWVVTGTCYLTKLSWKRLSDIKPTAGKSLTITVDGEEYEPKRDRGYLAEDDTLIGRIVLALEDKG